MKHFKLTTESKVNAFGITLFRIEQIIEYGLYIDLAIKLSK